VLLSRRVAKVIAIVVVGLAPWIAYLALALPPRYDARNWTVVWVGFDIALMAVLAHSAWAAWFRRQVMVATALIAGTLFLCDAWFDVMTSFGSRGEWVTLLTALGGELPAAAAFFWIARRGMRRTVLSFHELSGRSGPLPRVWDAPVLTATVSEPSSPRARTTQVEPEIAPEREPGPGLGKRGGEAHGW